MRPSVVPTCGALGATIRDYDASRGEDEADRRLPRQEKDVLPFWEERLLGVVGQGAREQTLSFQRPMVHVYLAAPHEHRSTGSARHPGRLLLQRQTVPLGIG